MNIKIIMILSIVLLPGCATTSVPLNQDLFLTNKSLIKDSVSIPGISNDSSTLIEIDGKETEYTSFSNIIDAGEHDLVFESSCKGLIFTKYYDSFVVTKKTERLTLQKGHTYKIIPILAKDNTIDDFVCLTDFKDLTDLNSK